VREARGYLIGRFRREPAAHILASDLVKRTSLPRDAALAALGRLVADDLLEPRIQLRCAYCGRPSSAPLGAEGDCVEHGDVPHRESVFYVATAAMNHIVDLKEESDSPKMTRLMRSRHISRVKQAAIPELPTLP